MDSGRGRTRDRAVSERDAAAEGRDRAAELRDRGAEDRDAQAREQERTASDRDQTWSDDDEASSRSDQRGADEDQQVADEAFAAGGDALRHSRGVLARKRSGRERAAVSVSRHETAVARLQEHDAHASAEDIRRAEAADDREDAADDRTEALHDRSEAAVAAQRALETLEAMSDAFFTLDSAWRFTYLNPRSETMLERRREDLVGKNLWEELPQAAGAPFEHECRRALREQIPVRFEVADERRNRTFEVRAHPVPAGLAIYFTDVTNERRRETRLRQAERLETLGRLTAGVAHDFNNLLTAVRGFASLGRAASGDEKLTGYFDQIDLAGERANALTRKLLAFGRQQELSPALVDLNEAVRGLSSLLGQLLPSTIAVRFALAPQPVVVFVDPSQFEQVLINLVVNARDAVGVAGSITIGTMTDEPPGVEHDVRVPCGWLQVTDDGAGIPDDVRPHIFEPFYTTKPPEVGTGLGLATIHGIVAQSGGSIFVDSTPGVGTTMSVALPTQPPGGSTRP
ncbi:MAG: two-component system sensor histidine kinase NtrB [Gaiellaceae bacterium]